jgi:lipoprotein-releasing system ATP-binding protein
VKIEARNLIKKFGESVILKQINVIIHPGEIVSIMGKSGSGKSTLLYALSGLDKITEGEIFYDDKNITQFSVHEMHDFRNLQMGFVFQFHYLLQEFSVLENVLMPTVKHNNPAKYRDFALHLLKAVGLEDKHEKLAREISGGEQQRVAIARSLIMRPQVIFADEPSGNLDSQNAKSIFELFFKFNQEFGTSIIYVTHDKDYGALAKRRIVIQDGIIL